jgi:hypothetical protein
VGDYGARRRLPISQHRNRLEGVVDDARLKLACVKGVMAQRSQTSDRTNPIEAQGVNARINDRDRFANTHQGQRL